MSARLIARWKLDGDARDSVADCHGQERDVSYGPGPFGRGAAVFDGLRSVIEIPDRPALRVGTDDFSLSLWVRCRKPMRGVFGDVVSKFDPDTRRGFNLSIAGSAAGYCSMCDTRHVHFGADDGWIGTWQDCGRPWPSNPLVPSLVVYDGSLYAGIADADDPMDAGRVFRWEGGQRWDDCGRLGADPKHLSVQSFLVHDGRLYAGTGVWDWNRAKDASGTFLPSPAHVFVYEGGKTWRDLGQVSDQSVRVLCLASFEGALYAGLDSRGGGHCVRYDGSSWKDLGAPDGRNFECLLPQAGTLYGMTHGNMYRYEGLGRWACIGTSPFGVTQIHSAVIYRGRLHAGTWPQGYVLRHERDDQWSIVGRLGLPEGQPEINEINALVVHNGKLYAGVLPKAQLWRCDGDGQWALLGALAARSDWSPERDAIATWLRLNCLTSFRGRLFAGTGTCHGNAAMLDPDRTCGRVLNLDVSHVVSHERDIGGEWTHLVAARVGKTLTLYVQGARAIQSYTPMGFRFDLANERPLLIGSGAQGTFDGAVADVRLYAHGLDQNAVRRLASGDEA